MSIIIDPFIFNNHNVLVSLLLASFIQFMPNPNNL